MRYDTNFDGTITATSQSSQVCEISSYNNRGFTCTVPGSGWSGVIIVSPGTSTRVTISCSGGTNYTQPGDKTITITYVDSGGSSGGGGGSSGGSQSIDCFTPVSSSVRVSSDSSTQNGNRVTVSVTLYVPAMNSGNAIGWVSPSPSGTAYLSLGSHTVRVANGGACYLSGSISRGMYTLTGTYYTS